MWTWPLKHTVLSCRMIVDKIDADKDGFVTEGELKSWIKHAQKKYIYDNVENQWQEFDMNQDGLISWDEYRNVTYGTYLGKGRDVRLAETVVLSQRNKWVRQERGLLCLFPSVVDSELTPFVSLI